MDRNVLKWGVDLALGFSFLICFVTGLLKWTLLLRLTGFSGMILPSALFSDLHDWSGIILGLLVLAHLFLNRSWIAAMTINVLGGSRKGN